MPRLLDIIGTGRPRFVPVSGFPPRDRQGAAQANQAIPPAGEALSSAHSCCSLAIKS